MSESFQNVRVRPILDQIAAYAPGKGLAGEVTKLSSNESPYPPLPEVVAAATEAVAGANRYPDMLANPLVDKIASTYRLAPEQITIGNGSCSLIAHMLQVVAGDGDEVVMPWRSFEAYPILIAVAGATAVPVPLADGFLHDPEALVGAVTDRTRAVLLCTPNNPTGTPLRAPAFDYIMNNLPEDILVFLDEAYFDFDDSPQRLNGFELVSRYPNLIAARTFSKAYGLSGLRVGYAVSSPFIAEGIRKTTTPFSVNIAAQAAAIEALNHREVIAKQVQTLISERERVYAEATRRGFRVVESSANFLWFPTTTQRDAICAACANAAVMVRAFPDGVRVSIGSPTDNDKFLAAIDTITSQDLG